MLLGSDSDVLLNLKEHVVNKSWLESILFECFSHEKSDFSPSVTVISYEVTKANEASEFVLSDILALSAEFQVNGELKNLDLVIKLLPIDPFSRYFVAEAGFDLREINFYTELVRDLNNFQSHQLRENENPVQLPVPKCYLGKYIPFALTTDTLPTTSDKINESIIVLEDLKKRGYQNVSFQSGLTLKQAEIAVAAVSRLHALSLAMKVHEKKPFFEKYDFLFQTEKASSSYQNLMERGLPQLTAFLDRRTDMKNVAELLSAIRPQARYLIEALLRPKEPISLITHTDFWSNNLLFTESDCILLDWQMVTCSQPTNDLALLIISSLPSEVRRNHVTHLLDHYWTNFTRNASKFKLDVESDLKYDKTEFLEDYKKSQLLALLLCIGSIDVALKNPEIEHRLVDVLFDLHKDGILASELINSL